jgi:hypothetical protein
MQQGTTKQRAAQRAQAETKKPQTDLLVPQLYTSQTGNVSVNLGRVFCQPAMMRRLIASILDDDTRAATELLCSQLEAAQAKAEAKESTKRGRAA